MLILSTVCYNACVFRFNIPDLKVGTLDALMAVSDDMIKTDTYMESVVRKLGTQLVDLLEDHKVYPRNVFSLL